jgi:hypothetical protein
VRVQLLFDGGPWADRLLDTEVATAPEFVAPDDGKPGGYWRTENQPDSQVVVYEWSPDDTAESHRRRRRARSGWRVGAAGVRFGLEVGGAACALVLAIVTFFSAHWIEVVFRVTPDRSSGGLEWGVVFALLTSSSVLTIAARQEWRRVRARVT